jgi:hypothetical protein
MVQLAEDAPDDIAPYTWSGSIGFSTPSSIYYSDITPDQDLVVPHDVNVAPDFVGGIDDVTDEAINDMIDNPAEFAQYLLDVGLEPDDVIGELTLTDAEADAIRSQYASLTGQALDEDFVRALLADGDVESIQDLMDSDADTISPILDDIASAGFDDKEADQAEYLAEILHMEAYIGDDGRWYLK